MDARFEAILNELHREHKEVLPRKLFGTEGMMYGSKLFCFWYDGAMVFKVGEDITRLGIDDAPVFQPFKVKPPMKNWRVVRDEKKWKKLARVSLMRIIIS